MPPTELIPFNANIAGAALTVFGLSLITCDGLVALIAAFLTFGGIGLILYHVI